MSESPCSVDAECLHCVEEIPETPPSLVRTISDVDAVGRSRPVRPVNVSAQPSRGVRRLFADVEVKEDPDIPDLRLPRPRLATNPSWFVANDAYEINSADSRVVDDGKSVPSKHRSYCFTINNPELGTWSRLVALEPKYLICGFETAPTTGTKHVQGYISFKNARSFNSVRMSIGGHVEVAKGSAEENFKYCSKEGNFLEFPSHEAMPKDPVKQGVVEIERWENAWTLAIAGQIEEIDADIRLRQYGTLRNVFRDYQVRPADLVGDGSLKVGIWLHGSSGCGKSRWARDHFPDAYLKPCSKWWDGYQDQETVIIDDFDKRHDVLIHHMKIWVDRYAFIAESKGWSRMIRPKRVIVTSNYAPLEIWQIVQDIEPIARRFQIWDCDTGLFPFISPSTD